jgi:HAD superfamily phosphoserine phosphatase-like hydrolase
MSNFKAAIFDIDGTLTPQISWTAFTRDIGGSVARHLAIYTDHLNGNIGLDESKRQLLEMWQATGKASRDHIEQVFETWPVRPEAYKVIEELKRRGYLICLITGSIGIYAKHMAEKLGVENYYANAELYFDNNGDLIDFHYTTDQADVKLAHLKEFCAKHDLRLQECVPVGDSNNDVEIFRETGNGVLLDDSTEVTDELRGVAWKVIDSLEDLLTLIES